MIRTTLKIIPIVSAVAMSVTGCSPGVHRQAQPAGQFPQYSAMLSMRSNPRLPDCRLHSNQGINSVADSSARANPQLPACHLHSNQSMNAVTVRQPIVIPVEQTIYHPDPDAPGPPTASPDMAPEPVILDEGSVYIHEAAPPLPIAAAQQPPAAQTSPLSARKTRRTFPPIVHGSLISPKRHNTVDPTTTCEQQQIIEKPKTHACSK